MKRLCFFISVLVLVGCAHPIAITPKTNQLPIKNEELIGKNVGYFISQADLDKEVTTPGGGGDSVKYKPYKDIESGIYLVLLNIYQEVFKLEHENSNDELAKHDITYVFIPTITTESSSTGTFTWPPTDFTVNIEMKAFDKNGQLIWTKNVAGDGHAEFAEFKENLSLSAQRASEEALVILQNAILSASTLK